jgi:chromosome segregation ATPase
MERREKEKERLKAREEFLENKEKELTSRIESLKEREGSLKKTEDRMREEIAALETERKGLGELKTPVAGITVAKGKWVVDGEELANVLRKSKKLREDWWDEQRKIQEAVSAGEAPESVVAESEDRIGGKEAELKQRIGELEKRLAEAISEERGIRAEEKDVISDMKKLKKVLKVLDDLLEKLPDDVVVRFAKSKDYKEYEELMDELDL